MLAFEAVDRPVVLLRRSREGRRRDGRPALTALGLSHIRALRISDGAGVPNPIKLIKTCRFSDPRGWFRENFVENRWADQLEADLHFVQDNQSYSARPGTLRGIHFQLPPHAQAKLIWCLRGSIYDVAVDLRLGSPTYGHYVSAELSAENGMQQFIPVGFGHGFVTLEPDTEVAYKVSDYYAPECEAGLRWDCPELGIDWPLPPSGPLLSSKDEALPGLAEFSSPFPYDGNPLFVTGD